MWWRRGVFPLTGNILASQVNCLSNRSQSRAQLLISGSIDFIGYSYIPAPCLSLSLRVCGSGPLCYSIKAVLMRKPSGLVTLRKVHGCRVKNKVAFLTSNRRCLRSASVCVLTHVHEWFTVWSACMCAQERQKERRKGGRGRERERKRAHMNPFPSALSQSALSLYTSLCHRAAQTPSLSSPQYRREPEPGYKPRPFN